MPEGGQSRGDCPRTALGFDFGRARIGIAVGQDLTATAHAVATLAVRNGRPDWNAITRVIAEWRPALLVVGVPHQADGGANPITVAALRFSRQLNGRYGLPVETIDERLSSHEAEGLAAAILPRSRRRGDKGVIDGLAAALILESWFTQQRTNPTCRTLKN